uniref:DBF4 zinc finger B n=1 Tax=Apteryx owenii TaxID=8824 RepID=A0A8B9PNY1_APTOW
MAGPAAARPLRGKSFYLDVPSGRSARELAEAIRHLGGVTESFLSKEVSYVVSSSKEAKRDKARTRTEKWSNVTSEGAKAKSPVPSASKGNHTRPHQKPPDTALISRGKELLQKVMKNQDTCSGNGILASARLWGVQIVHVDEMLSYAQQLLHAISGARKRSQKTEAKCLAPGSKVRKGKLKPPFLKVEDQSRQFRPFHYQFKSFPNLNFLAPKSSSPFEPLKSLLNSCRARDMEGCPMLSEGEKSPQSTPVTVPKKKRGFCECCQETFEELQKHLQSPQHKRFALDDSQYAPVDHVISQLTNNFVEQSAKVPQSCLTDEHLMPQAQVTRGNEMLTAELRKESQQAPVELFIDAEADPGLKMKECSSHLPSNRADLDFRTASESDWDIGLLSMLTGVQGSRILPVDRHLLRRTCVSVRDSGYESQLRSVLKQKPELDWAGKDDKNCRNCCTETEGASFPISETPLGSWTS